MKRISIVGLGRIGLCTAVYFASKGYDVIASSNQEQKLGLLKKAKCPFFEPELGRMLRAAIRTRKLRVVAGREEAVLNTDVTFITVGTPSLPDGSADLRFLGETAKELGSSLKEKRGYHVFVVKSTVPPGTTETLVKPNIEENSGKHVGRDFGLAMSPEFLREGSLMHDVANPDRVVIGEYDGHSGDVLEKLNRELYGKRVPILRMSLASAELSKYASNAFLATKISFINEIANMCERIAGVDVGEIANAMGLDPRIGTHFLRAGAGWGGSCFPKDTKALIALSKRLGHNPGLIEACVSTNLSQARHMVELAEEELGSLKGRTIAILGLAFKPDTDDIREAPSIRIIEALLEKGANIAAFDPEAMDNVLQVLGSKISYSESVDECLKNADCCMLVTEWPQFKKLRPEDFVRLMRNPILIDGRRIYDPEIFSKKLKLRAIGIGIC